MATTRRKTRKPRKLTEAQVEEFVERQREITRLVKARADLDLRIVEEQAKLAMSRAHYAFGGGGCLVE